MEKKRRGGWPARTPEPGERVPMSFRVTPAAKARLDDFAARTGRSLAQEIELRLAQSDQGDDQLGQALERLYGRKLAGLLTLLGCVMRDVGQMAHQVANRTVTVAPDWMADAFACRQVVRAVTKLLVTFCAEGEGVPAHLLEPMIMGGVDLNEVHRNLGRVIAASYLTAIADPELAASGDLTRIGAEIREKLGNEVAERARRERGVPARRSVRKTQADE